jgi:2-polyprenyl-3-methyl-5-hydroxy-6-metoxy-1,4-benzoquinol methylase
MSTRLTSELGKSLENVTCDLCNHSKEEFLYTKLGTLTKYPFRVVRCRSCGLIYLNPRLKEEVIAELYNREYYDGKGFDPYVNYLADFKKENDDDKRFRPENTVKLIKEMAHPPATLLDFGCGLGDLMKQAAKNGYTAEGFEVSKFSAEFARANGFRIYANIDELPRERYDIVTAIEVLEHCTSPMKAILAIYNCLKPGGYFYYTTANFDHFYKNWRLGIKDTLLDGYIEPEGHIHFFSSSVMKLYFGKIGFRRVFKFESKVYQKHGRLFKILSKLGLTNTITDAPVTLLERYSYYGGRYVATMLGLRKIPNLPMARK